MISSQDFGNVAVLNRVRVRVQITCYKYLMWWHCCHRDTEKLFLAFKKILKEEFCKCFFFVFCCKYAKCSEALKLLDCPITYQKDNEKCINPTKVQELYSWKLAIFCENYITFAENIF